MRENAFVSNYDSLKEEKSVILANRLSCSSNSGVSLLFRLYHFVLCNVLCKVSCANKCCLYQDGYLFNFLCNLLLSFLQLFQVFIQINQIIAVNNIANCKKLE